MPGTASPQTAPPTPARSRQPLQLALILVAAFMVVLDFSIVNVALPSIERAFGSVVLASAGCADSDQGLVGGMINTSRQIGAAVGAALLPAVAASVSGTGPTPGVSGDRAAMLTAGLAALAATAIAWHAAHLRTAS